MSTEASWGDEPDLDEETAARLDRFLQAGMAETLRLLDESVDVEQKLAESLARLAADDSKDTTSPPDDAKHASRNRRLGKWRHTA
ncbi:hypothetical protein [Streptomyces griseosporeus]